MTIKQEIAEARQEVQKARTEFRRLHLEVCGYMPPPGNYLYCTNGALHLTPGQKALVAEARLVYEAETRLAALENIRRATSAIR